MMRIFVQFSSGKDSHAALLLAAEKYGVENVEAVFCDTGWEHEITYIHLKEVVQMIGVKLRILSSNKYDGFIDMVKHRKRFPSSGARFCTQELKVYPMIDFILDEVKESFWTIQGIRSDESESRSKMSDECRLFKYYFEPYQTNEWIVRDLLERLKVKGKLTINQRKKLKKAQDRLAIGKNDEKYYTYRKSEVFDFCKSYDDSLFRPVFSKSVDEVIEIIESRGHKLNPLYEIAGAIRVGCFPCIMVSHSELMNIIRFNPERLDYLAQLEIEMETSFFSPDYIPKRFCSKVVIAKTGKNAGKEVRYPTVKDVVDYIKSKNATGDLFLDNEQEEGRACMSYLIQCE